eukprot:Gregarina_sp_Poly_1__2813@NODE_1782_length_3337_cov_32_956575_g1160_i0_p5_GENE_NODE_1782_length_3337_cov_32_956575_g1160_i0NODE_1782_length_3337_cov_32_956575_g1160_i0_p5_ORF_typecomplete_len100_score6_35Tis11B_N/PF04553_12/3_9Tis11B_N/PF04553_12/1_3e02_NODE_1782_length_3337_cov_32_956575_g1160_i017662065
MSMRASIHETVSLLHREVVRTPLIFEHFSVAQWFPSRHITHTSSFCVSLRTKRIDKIIASFARRHAAIYLNSSVKKWNRAFYTLMRTPMTSSVVLLVKI